MKKYDKIVFYNFNIQTESFSSILENGGYNVNISFNNPISKLKQCEGGGYFNNFKKDIININSIIPFKRT